MLLPYSYPSFAVLWGNYFLTSTKIQTQPHPHISARAVYLEVFRSVDYLLAFSQTH